MKMLKTLALSALLVTGSAFAEDTQDAANALYSKRGESIKNAQDAADMFNRLAAAATNEVDKVNKMNAEAQALYYVGTHIKEDKEKKPVFERAMSTAEKAIDILCNGEKKCEDISEKFADVEKDALANAYYQYGANLGKWAEANGIASSLSKWPELERTMKKIIALKKEAIQSFGAYRILGRAYYKLPAPLGSNKKAEQFLKKGFEETKNGGDISTHGLTNMYYADLLIATDRKAEAKAILSAFVKKDPATLNPARIPETKEEIAEALEKLKDL